MNWVVSYVDGIIHNLASLLDKDDYRIKTVISLSIDNLTV